MSISLACSLFNMTYSDLFLAFLWLAIMNLYLLQLLTHTLDFLILDNLFYCILFVFFLVLGIRTSCLSGRCYITELHPGSLLPLLSYYSILFYSSLFDVLSGTESGALHALTKQALYQWTKLLVPDDYPSIHLERGWQAELFSFLYKCLYVLSSIWVFD